jgi:acetyl-CoA acyltransferase
MSDKLVLLSKAKTLGQRLSIAASIRPKDFVPITPAIAEPSTGETMGESAEKMAKINHISREEQDQFALRSHRLSAVGVEDGRLTAEIQPTWIPPKYEDTLTADNGIRKDTSIEQLRALKPVFDRRYGSVTAGNASPLTDGGSAVLLMSEDKAKALGYQPLAWVRSYAYAALDPGEQLLMGPVLAAPVALERAKLTLKDMDLIEMHEAFAAQVLSNIQWIGSKKIAVEKLGRSSPVGDIDPEKINRTGGSIALGHPFGATGARIVTTVCNELQLTGQRYGLVTVCAAGGIGVAMVLERE